MREHLLTIENLRFQRDDFTLQIPEWSVQAGHVIGLVGPNAAGKTTLLELLCGVQAPQQGRIQLFGHDPAQAPDIVRLKLGFMSDDLPLPDLRVDALLKNIPHDILSVFVHYRSTQRSFTTLCYKPRIRASLVQNTDHFKWRPTAVDCYLIQS